MNILTNLMIAIVALLHIYFLVLEMFLWAKPIGLKVFGHSIEKAYSTKVLAANQGLYNGFLAMGLLWGLFAHNDLVALQFKLFFLTCIIVAGIYGSITVSRKILFIQAVPAGLASALLLFNS